MLGQIRRLFNFTWNNFSINLKRLQYLLFGDTSFKIFCIKISLVLYRMIKLSKFFVSFESGLGPIYINCVFRIGWVKNICFLEKIKGAFGLFWISKTYKAELFLNIGIFFNENASNFSVLSAVLSECLLDLSVRNVRKVF